MKTCIYCLRNESEVTYTRRGEHVIPQAFGHFGSQTPILKSVCSDCNQYLGDHLDIALSRDSIEGINRYRQGIRSSSSAPQKKMQIRMTDEERPKGVPDIHFYVDGQTNELMPTTGLKLIDEKTKEHTVITSQQFDSYDFTGWIRSGIQVEVWGDENILKVMIEKLKEKGMKFKTEFVIQKMADAMPKKKGVEVEITALIDETIKRAVSKILFNFVAFYAGDAIVLDAAWNQAREYVREGKGTLPFKVYNGVFWDQETEHVRIKPEGVNIRIEDKGGAAVGFLQMYDLMIYEVELSKVSVPKDKQVGFKFVDGHEPISVSFVEITSPLYTAQIDMDAHGRPRWHIQRYGPK